MPNGFLLHKYRKFLIVVALAILSVAAIFGGAMIGFFKPHAPAPSIPSPIPSPSPLAKVNFPREFAALTFQDPLFWDYSLDPSRFETAVQDLRGMERKFRDLAAERGIPSNEILFMPFSLLEALPAVGRATGALLAEPSGANGTQLLETYETALTAYENEVERLRATSEKYFPEPRNDIIPENELASGGIALLEKNAAALRTEIERRVSCATTGACAIRLTATIVPPAPSTFRPRLPETLLFPRPADFSVRGIVRVPTECWDQDPSRPWHELYLGEKNLANGEKVLRVKLADNNLYGVIPNETGARDLVAEGRISRTDAAIYASYRNAGVPFDMLDEGSLARCADLAHYPRALTLLWLKTKLQSGGNAANLDAQVLPQAASLILSAQALEKTIAAAEAPSWDQAVRLASLYQSLLELHNRNIIRLTDTTFAALTKDRLAIVSGLPNFEELLTSIAKDFRNRELLYRKSDYIPPPQNRFIINSLFSLTYFTFSNAFWRISDTFEWLPRLKPEQSMDLPLAASSLAELQQNPPRYFVWLSQIRPFFTTQQIVEWMQRSYDIRKSSGQ